MFLVNDRDMSRPDAERRADIQLRNLRVANGWSQREVAERMKAFGYDWQQATVARIEAASRPLRLNELLDLAALYNVPLTDLLAPPRGRDPESVKEMRQEAEALHQALAQEVERAERAEGDIAKATEEYTLARAALASIQSRLQLLEEWEKEALGDGEA
jgi:transcriptional regulator with XRE-family HTH domain